MSPLQRTNYISSLSVKQSTELLHQSKLNENMTSPDSVQFKVSLLRPNQPEEIRRFTIEKDVVTNYSYLRQKLYAIFPNLQSTGMTISWKDSDDDLVTIGSDEELIIALTEMEEICKKILVRPVTPGGANATSRTGETLRPQNHPKVVHEGVTCGGCDSEFSGYRYKCMVCPEFNLCFECEQEGFHPEHVMIRYPFSLAKSKDYHFVKKLKKLHKKFDHHQVHCDSEFEGHDHRKSFKGPRGNRCPSLSRDVAGLVEDFASNLRAHVAEVTPELIQEVLESLSALNMSETNGPNTSAAHDAPSGSKKHGEQSKKKDKEDRNSKKRGCPFAQSRTERSAQDEPMITGHPPLDSIISSVMQQVGAVAPHVVPNILSALNQMSAAVNTNATSAPPAPTESQTSPSSAATTGSQVNSGASDQEGQPIEPMVINLDDDSQKSTSAPPQPANPSTYQETPNEFQLLIERQLQSMLDMGFNNEGGWLRDLLVANSGNITKVLDHLGNSAFKGGSRIELD